MTLSYLPAGRRGFVPRPCGFGARLLGLDPAAVRTDPAGGILATRQERDLLRGDLTLVGGDGTLLPEALGCALAQTAQGSWRVAGAADVDPDEWDLLELGAADDHPALAAALQVVAALAREGAVGVLLTGPLTLAEHVAGHERRAAAGEDEDLVDACGLVVCDAAKLILEAGGHVVLEERRAPTADELGLCSPLLNLLVHHRRPALALVHADGAGAFADGHAAIGAAVSGAAVPEWGAPWNAPAEATVLAPRIAAAASPERVQELVRALPGAAAA
ncbi:hypothetical protein DSM112329_05364 [Paraconexibacter sp. AEG42_29]|uniref:Uncharacterized protein n=1 Tax=Paraconexibacter sp. AEG42_29 TaxID=2997339 RepID=A0AAU7B468_9ACTN